MGWLSDFFKKHIVEPAKEVVEGVTEIKEKAEPYVTPVIIPVEEVVEPIKKVVDPYIQEVLPTKQLENIPFFKELKKISADALKEMPLEELEKIPYFKEFKNTAFEELEQMPFFEEFEKLPFFEELKERLFPDRAARPNWMKNVDGKKKLNELAIPGTHDSGTEKIVASAMAQCQTRSIPEQLNDGIRFLDIRVGENGDIFHGPAPCFLSLTGVIDDCISYLKNHKSETILVCISNESIKEADYRGWSISAFGKERYQHWYKETRIPTLDEVRGKMVLIYGDDLKQGGISLKNDFVRQNDWDVGEMTDSWSKRADAKVKLITDFLDQSWAECEKMRQNNWNKQFNFYNLEVSIRDYANYINNKMKSFKKYPKGIQCMDYYHQPIVHNIINSN